MAGLLDEGLLQDILAASFSLHSAGPISAKALRAMARRLSSGKINRSVETGAGATTLLFSHLSGQHTVFSLDEGGSNSAVRSSLLLNDATVTFIEGPTQRTLPFHHFEGKIDAALLDGPHAYPFPQLEYYWIYPHLAEYALLILDDIQIRSVHELYCFLRADEMFELLGVAGRTAFFRRTSTPAFDPLGDGWWMQGINKRPLLRYVWLNRLKESIPPAWRSSTKDMVRRIAVLSRRVLGGRHASIRINHPREGDAAGASGVVRGRAAIPAGTWLWLLARRKDQAGWWPQGGSAVRVGSGEFRHECKYGEPSDAGEEFEIALVVVDEKAHRRLERWVEEGRRSGLHPPIPFPEYTGCAPAKVTLIR